MTTQEVAVLQKRLGVVIALLLRNLSKTKDTLSLHDQVELLSDLGLRPKDIAEILGRTPTYVNKELAMLRKGKKAKKQ